MLAKPFIVREESINDKCTIASLFGNRKYTGQVGIEVEVEGNKFPKQSPYPDDEVPGAKLVPPEWGYHHDGSLRGQDNAEYVTRVPIQFSDVPVVVKDLWTMFDKFGSVLDESNRTSVHVHVNVQEFRLNRLCAFAALYFCVEDILTAWCGDHRVGNLFCLRAKDAPAIVSKLRRLIANHETRSISKDDGLHYSAFNVQSLSKFGSVEIRTLRGVTDPRDLITWVGIIERLYNLSETYANNPCEIVEGFSGRPYQDFIRDILGEFTDEVLLGCRMSDSEIRNSTLDGVRIAQHLCYCRDWSKFPKEALQPDPFGRSVQMLEQLNEYESILSMGPPQMTGLGIPTLMNGFIVPSEPISTAPQAVPVSNYTSVEDLDDPGELYVSEDYEEGNYEDDTW